MRSRFDPRGMTKAMEERNAEAQAAAMAFSEDLKSGALDPKSAKFKQGLMAKDMKEEGLVSQLPAHISIVISLRNCEQYTTSVEWSIFLRVKLVGTIFAEVNCTFPRQAGQLTKSAKLREYKR